MELIFIREYPWQLWAAAVAVILGVLVVVAGIARNTPGCSTTSRRLVGGFTLLSTLLLAVALCGPALLFRQPGGTFHIPVLIDVSDSVLRTEGGWPALQPVLVERLRRAFSETASASATAHVISFRSETARFGATVPLRSIWKEIGRLSPPSFATGDGTDIAKALRSAAEEIEQAGGRGAVLLISDGNETDGDAAAEARRLAEAGISVHVLPVEGANPALVIASANLPPYVESGKETFARGVLRNDSNHPADAELELVRGALNGEADASAAQPRLTGVRLEPRAWGRFRTPVSFENPGLQYVDVALRQGQRTYRRRLFTYVESPPRVLCLGDDPWTKAFPAGALQFDRKAPGSLTVKDLATRYDGFVIDSVPGGEFGPGVLSKIADAVKERGTGLFLMNGRHSGPPAGPTNLMSYKDTPIEPLEPLVAGPRPHDLERARSVVMMIDGSSSMGGAPLIQEQEIATYLISNVLTAKDHLEVLAFTTSCEVVVPYQQLNPEAKAHAIDRIKSIVADGGTDPKDCMQLMKRRNLSECGIVFLSDGYFAPGLAVYRPDCRVTAFGIGRSSFPAGDPLRELADPIPVLPGFDPSNIKIPYFQKRPDDRYFEPGAYRPLSMAYFQPWGQVEVPEIRLEGSATTFPKVNARVMAVRPKLTDPVLAFQESGSGNVGEFTSSLPDEWLSSEDGRRAIRQWISEILPIADRRRYAFQITQTGNTLDIQITLTPRLGKLPRVDHLDAVLEAGSARMDLPLVADPAVPDVFHGSIRLPANAASVPGILVLRESGSDAQARPQRVAILIPPGAEVAGPPAPEAWTYGLNESLLRRIAETGGGSYDMVESTGRGAFRGRSDPRPIWQIFAVAGCACYLGAVLSARLDL